VVENVVVDI